MVIMSTSGKNKTRTWIWTTACAQNKIFNDKMNTKMKQYWKMNADVDAKTMSV